MSAKSLEHIDGTKVLVSPFVMLGQAFIASVVGCCLFVGFLISVLTLASEEQLNQVEVR